MERSKPFISRDDLICVQHDAPFQGESTFVAGGCVKLSLHWSKYNFYKSLLPEITVWDFFFSP